MSSTIASTMNSHAAALPQQKRAADRASRSGIWIGVFTITMSFAAFTSALFVREGTADWGHLVLPSVLYLNTLVLLLSSATFELSRHSLAAGTLIAPEAARKASRWLLLTLLLGLGFCAGQFVAWHELRGQGIYLATNPNSSFFYVLTFAHALHVLAGIAALVYLVARLMAGHATFRRSFFENTAIYWHFMGFLWVYLYLLYRIKL